MCSAEEAGLALLAGAKQFTAAQVANKRLPLEVEQALDGYIRSQTMSRLPCSTLVMLQFANIQDTPATRQKACRYCCALLLFLLCALACNVPPSVIRFSSRFSS